MMKSDGRVPNIRERYFDSQSYLPQNPYDASVPGNYYPYPPGYEMLVALTRKKKQVIPLECE